MEFPLSGQSRPFGRAYLADGKQDVGGQRAEIGGLVGGGIGRRWRGNGDRPLTSAAPSKI